MVRVQQLKNGALFVYLPDNVVEKMRLQKGDEVAFVVDSVDCARFKAIR